MDRKDTTEYADVSSDNESEDGGSPKIFENLFSDSEDDIDHKRVISAVREANNSASSVFEQQESHHRNLDDSNSSRYSVNRKHGDSSHILSGNIDNKAADNRIIQTDRCFHDETLESADFKELSNSSHEQCPSLCSSCSSSDIDSDDDCSFSDDDNQQHWKTTSQPSKKHKNLIPVRKNPHLNEETITKYGSNMPGNISADTSRHSKEYISAGYPSMKSQQYSERSTHILGDNQLYSDSFNKGTEDGQSHSQLGSNFTSASGHRDTTKTHPTVGHQRLRHVVSGSQSPTSTGRPTRSSSSSASIHEAFQQSVSTSKNFMSENEDNQHRSNNTCRHTSRLSYVSQTSSKSADPRSTSDFTKTRTTNELGVGHSQQGTRFRFNAQSEKSNTSTASCETFGVRSDPSGESDFELWNESWSIDDCLICPNFLKGAPLDEAVFDRYNSELTHQRYVCGRKAKPLARKVPRMYHRRVKKLLDEEREESRTHRFSDVAPLMDSPLSTLFKMVKEMRLDVAKVLENAGRYGMPLNMPCMQCTEGTGPNSIATELLQGYESSAGGRCRRCGGQIQTLESMGKMISKLRQIVDVKKFVIRDVYPDGNCMFGTVIDQLRVRGDFRYTIHSLRKAVVGYLRDNPTAEDGTHYEMFLTNESWEGYLNRMSEDGQWGDHMVLSALANVLQTRIVIYGGRSGETETVIAPKQPGEESPTEAESQEKNRRLPAIYLGHFGETHYVSLRPENWSHHLQEVNTQVIQKWQLQKFEDLDPEQSIVVPIQHIDFILRNTFQLEYISSYMSYMSKIPEGDSGSEFDVTLVGPIMCKMAPDFNSKTESISPDIDIFFPSSQYRAPSSCTVITAFQTPMDTVVQKRSCGEKSFDLLPERSSSGEAHLKILPVTPDLWKGQTMQSSEGSVCLRAVDIECFDMEGVPLSYGDEELTIHRILAFKSEWPEVANEWIVRQRRSHCPHENAIQTVASLGCHVVPITSNENQCNIIDSYITSEMIGSQDQWSYSFATAEVKLSSYLCNTQRCCFLLFKTLLDFTYCEPPLPAALSKSVFFYAWENIEQAVWRIQPGRCLIAMLQKLAKGLQMSFIPHYFISGQNLLENAPPEHIAMWSRNIESVVRQPIVPLYFVLDILDITATEIGALFDDILEDLPKYNCHQNIVRSLNETFTSASATLIENLIYQREFQHAMTSLEYIHEQICQFSRTPVDIANVIEMLLSGMAVGYRWCFGLYIDLMKGSAITRKLSHGYELVHITELYGPDIDDDMPNTVVPAFYSISSGDLKFPTVCADVMLQAGKPRLVAKCLRYYIDTYSEAAGGDIIIEKGQMTNRRANVKSLQGLYMTLLEAYTDIGKPEEFRDLMSNLVMITERLPSHSSCRDLAFAWEELGEISKAKDCCTCYDRPLNMKGMIQQLLGNLQAYGY